MTDTIFTTRAVALMTIVIGLMLSPIAFSQADAYRRSGVLEETENTFVIRGDLTAPFGSIPFGGEVVGDYFLMVNERDIRIVASIDGKPSQGMVFEGWLVDFDTEYSLSLGQFHEELFFREAMANPWVYDLLVITEEPTSDTESSSIQVGGTLLARPFGQ